MVATDGGLCRDIIQAVELVDCSTIEHLIDDSSYAAQAFYDWIIENYTKPVIPPYPQAKEEHEYDRWLYRESHLIECFINKIKHFRRGFSRFHKLACRYLGILQFDS